MTGREISNGDKFHAIVSLQALKHLYCYIPRGERKDSNYFGFDFICSNKSAEDFEYSVLDSVD